MSLSPHQVLKVALVGDLLFSLENRRRSEDELPFAGLTSLLLVFLSTAGLVFLKGNNVVALALVSAFIAWWTAFVFSILILLLFGLSAPERYLNKATYLVISAIAAPAMLLSISLLFDFDNPYWLGASLPAGYEYWAAILYTLPYTTLCLANSHFALRRRMAAIKGATKPRGARRLQRAWRILFGKAAASYVAVTLVAALLLWATVIDDQNIAQQVIVETEEAIPALSFL